MRRPHEKYYMLFFLGLFYAAIGLAALTRIGWEAAYTDYLPSAIFALTLMFCAVFALGACLTVYTIRVGVFRIKERLPRLV